MDSECLLISKIHKKTFQYCSILQSKDQRDFTSGQLFSIPIVYEIERGNNELMVKLNMPEKAELLTRTFAFFHHLKFHQLTKLLTITLIYFQIR